MIKPLNIGPSRHEVVSSQRGPVWFPGQSLFISGPAHVRPGITKNCGIRLKTAYDLPGIGPVIIVLAIDRSRLASATIKAITTIGAIKENLKDGTITSHEFSELIAKVGKI